MKELQEVEEKLKKLSKKLSKKHSPGRWKPESYIGAGESNFVFLNLKIPHVRKAAKDGYSFSGSSLEQRWKIWNYIWKNSKYFEVVLSAAHFANAQPQDELIKNIDIVMNWIDRVDNWALSDELSNLCAKILEADRKKALPLLEQWGRSNNPWKKRQSMVGLLYYSRFRNPRKVLPFKKIISHIEPHLNDDHYYVQKAVGWTIRECWNLYPEKTYRFLLKNAKQIAPAGWTAATEKLEIKDKTALLKIRKS